MNSLNRENSDQEKEYLKLRKQNYSQMDRLRRRQEKEEKLTASSSPILPRRKSNSSNYQTLAVVLATHSDLWLRISEEIFRPRTLTHDTEFMKKSSASRVLWSSTQMPGDQ